MTLVEFLKARLDEDEAAALAASQESWDDQYGEFRSRGGETFAHVLRHDPARELRKVKGDRLIIAEIVDALEEPVTYENVTVLDIVAEKMLRALALTYADHPDYRSEWAA